MKNLAVLTGGFSSESNISMMSAKKVYDWIDKSLYSAYIIVLAKEDWYYESDLGEITTVNKNDFSIQLNDQYIKFDLAVFFPLHGTPAEDGKIQGYLDMLQVPYTGCDVLSSAISFDKSACKTYLKAFDIKMAKSLLCLDGSKSAQHTETVLNTLSFPMFVKPNKQGSSYGISKVSEASQLQDAIINSFKFDNEVLVEEYIAGREFSCGVYQLNGLTEALPPTEIISQSAFFDYEAKYLGKSQEITPANLDEKLKDDIQSLSKKIFLALGFSTLARIDFILNENTFYFLEANTTPGMTNESLVPQQVRAAGMNIESFINNLIADRLALN